MPRLPSRHFFSSSFLVNLCVIIPIWVGTVCVSATADEPDSGASLSDGSELRTIEKISKEIVIRTNEFRREHDLQPLTVNKDLQAAARYFAKYMANSDQYGHRADGNSPAERAEAKGYDYCVVRENIAYRTNSGEPTRESLTEVFVQGWIDSPEHRENMLADFITETGVSVATDDGVTFYAVQKFGRPKSKSITLKIANTSESSATLVIRSADSVQDVVLQPRMQLRMTRCFPTTLSIKSSSDAIKVNESTEMIITEEGLEKGEVPEAIQPAAAK